MDDEETLDEQERLDLLNETNALSELDALKKEAEVPLEDLLPPGYQSISDIQRAYAPKKNKK